MYMRLILLIIKHLIYSLLIFFYTINVFADTKIYYLSLKNNKTNVRQGPSFDYPIKLIIKKKFLPVKVIDSYENFKKITDIKNNNGWIHVSQLSKKKTAINIKKFSLILDKPKIYSKPVAKLEYGKLLIIKKCNNNWCKVFTNSYVGWIKKKNLWGNF
jgi:SH3-like domain-containing protein